VFKPQWYIYKKRWQSLHDCYATPMGGHYAVLQLVHPSVCPVPLCENQCILRLQLLQNTNSKRYSVSRTHWSARPYHKCWKIGGCIFFSLTLGRYLVWQYCWHWVVECSKCNLQLCVFIRRVQVWCENCRVYCSCWQINVYSVSEQLLSK